VLESFNTLGSFVNDVRWIGCDAGSLPEARVWLRGDAVETLIDVPALVFGPRSDHAMPGCGGERAEQCQKGGLRGPPF